MKYGKVLFFFKKLMEFFNKGWVGIFGSFRGKKFHFFKDLSLTNCHVFQSKLMIQRSAPETCKTRLMLARETVVVPW